jgi:hypothetical protein
MNARLTTLLTTITLSALALSSAEEIHFQKGASSATVKGTLHIKGRVESEYVSYQVRASEGQTMKIRFKGIEQRASYLVFCPSGGGTEAGAAEWTFTLPESGTYKIDIHGEGTAPTIPYEVEVTVTGKPRPMKVVGVTGTYTRDSSDNESNFEIIETPGGRLRFHLDAYWSPPSAPEADRAPNIGTLTGTATLNNGKAVYDQDGCKLTLAFQDGDLAVKQDGDCPFGMGVDATGTYSRTSVCAGPGRWRD